MNSLKLKQISGGLGFIVLCSLLVGGEEPVVKKVNEYDRDKDGKTDLRRETLARGRQMLFLKTQRKLGGGVWSETRAYFVAGEMLTMEEDKDGDGFFETFIVFNPRRKDLEVYTRAKDGSVTVESPEARESYRKMFDAIDEFWEKAFEAPDEKGFEKLFDETKEAIDRASKGLEKPGKQPKLDSPHKP